MQDMSDIRYEFPLKMPPSWHMTPLAAREHPFNFPSPLPLDEAIRMLEDEIHAIGIRDVAVLSNVQNLNNPRLRKTNGYNTGVSIQFGRNDSTAWLACDKWQLLEHNIYALHLALRAIKNIELWGIVPAVSLIASLYGNTSTANSTSTASTTSTAQRTANAPHDTTIPEWMVKLGLGLSADIEDAHAVYRRRAKSIANDEHALLELNDAMEQARHYFAKK
jgi:hypothetical protein